MFELKKMTAVFQLYPLSFAHRVFEHVSPSESVDCSKMAMTVLQVIYILTEERLRKCKFFLGGFFLYVIYLIQFLHWNRSWFAWFHDINSSFSCQWFIVAFSFCCWDRTFICSFLSSFDISFDGWVCYIL
jgi:hypothetical protein